MSEIVSRETFEKFEIYKKLLVKWQNAINLVSRETLKDLDERHFNDSLQLLKYIPQATNTHIDIGSGAGFPGLVLAIANSNLSTTLVESDLRKCQFLKNVSRETMTPVSVLNGRIETIQGLSYDLITARALANLNQLLIYAKPLSHDNTVFLFLKGAGVDHEISEAQKFWDFNLEIFPSLTHSEGKIIRIQNLNSK